MPQDHNNPEANTEDFTNSSTSVGFARVKEILDKAMTAWEAQNGQSDLSNHGPSFSWATNEQLKAAVGHGKRLIEPNKIGTGLASTTFLVIDLRTGTSPPLRMPKGGPFVPEDEILEIEQWIDAGCPD